MAVAQQAHALGGERERQAGGLHDDVVVAQGLPLLDAHRGRPYGSRRGGDVRRITAGDVDQLGARELAHPGQLALRVAPGAHLHRGDVAVQQLGEPERRPGGVRRACCVGAADLLDRAGRDHRVDPVADALRQRRPVHRQADQARRVTGRRGPQLAAVAVGDALLVQLQRADHPRAVGRLDARGHVRQLRAQSRVQRLRPVGLHLRREPLADARPRRRPHAQVGERRAEVQAGPADDDRRRPLARADRRSRRARAARTPPPSRSP